jgi:flagellar hook-length control protein FliK
MTISNASMPSALLLSDIPSNASLDGQTNIQLSTVDGDQISLSKSDFFSMLSQNLIQLVSEEDGQVIDNKKLMSMLSGSGTDLKPLSDETLPSEWMQFLKSHFSSQSDSDPLDQQLLKDGDQGDKNSATDPDAVDLIAIPVVIPVNNLKGDALPPERQSLSTSPAKISALGKLDGVQAVETESGLDSGEPDIDLKSVINSDINQKDKNAKNSAEVVNIRQQATATDTVTIKSAESSSNSLQSAVPVQISQTSHSATQALPPHLQSISVSANNQQWGDALGERVSFLINQKMNNAEIRIDPPHLGKLDIQIHIKDDTAQVVIHTQHAQTRDLVDSSSFRLREILHNAGYSSVDVNVSHHDSSSNQHASSDGGGASNSEQSGPQDTGTVAVGPMQQASIAVANGRIDYFA